MRRITRRRVCGLVSSMLVVLATIPQSAPAQPTSSRLEYSRDGLVGSRLTSDASAVPDWAEALSVADIEQRAAQASSSAVFAKSAIWSQYKDGSSDIDYTFFGPPHLAVDPYGGGRPICEVQLQGYHVTR